MVKPVRVLELITVPADFNGLTRFPMRLMAKMDPSAVRADLLTYAVGDERIRGEIEAMGARLYVAPHRLKHPLRYMRFVASLVRENRYDIVHLHGNSCTLAIDLWAAKRGGARVRIAHSHNTACKFTLLHRLLRPAFNALYTHAYACGDEAGRWLFGRKPFRIIPNAVDAEALAFSEPARADVRAEFGLKDEPLLGHVGNFVPAKNPLFLMEVLNRLPECRLLLAGDGPMRAEVEARSAEMGLSGRVIFAGARGDMPRLYSAMDALLLPSLFEGFPTVALESQCAGLPTILSEAVTRDCALTDFAAFEPLDAERWAARIREGLGQNRAQQSAEGRSAVVQAGHDLTRLAADLQAEYLRLAQSGEPQK